MSDGTSSGMRGSLDHPPIVIASATRKTLWLLVGCAVFVGLAAFMIAKGPATPTDYMVSYGGVVLFGLGACVAVWRLISPARLTLSPQGLDFFSGRKTQHFAWSEFSTFVAYRPSTRSIAPHVGFIRARGGDGVLEGIGRRVTGVDGSFGGGWTMGSAELVDLLNDAKGRWG